MRRIGLVKQGRLLEQLGAELQRQREARQDFVTDTRNINFEAHDDGQATMTLQVAASMHTFGVDELAHKQIAGRHVDAETTMQIYADATEEFKNKEMKNFGKFFKVAGITNYS